MFTTIYKPKDMSQFIGNDEVKVPFINWLLNWEPNSKSKKCALIYGLCGIGKTLFVDLMLHKHDYNKIELSSDDERNKEYINDVIKPMIQNPKTFDDQCNALVVNDIDAGCDYGFLSSLIDCIKITKIPIICICNNKYEQNIKPILTYCVDFKMIKPSYNDVYRLMYNIVIAEKIKIKESEIHNLYDQSNGDIRFILNTLQFGCRNGYKQNQSLNIFETSGKLLSIDETIDDKYNIYWQFQELHSLMVQENYINNTLTTQNNMRQLTNLCYTADALSDTDIIDSNIHMSNWDLAPYVAMNVINAASKCNKKSMIKFTQFLGKISTINKNKREKKDINHIGNLQSQQTIETNVKTKSTKKTNKEPKDPKAKKIKTKS